MPFGVFSGRGWLFSFVFQKIKNKMLRIGPPSDVGVSLLVCGAILAFPVHVRGGWPNVGDCHATQGGGELPAVTDEQRCAATSQAGRIRLGNMVDPS